MHAIGVRYLFIVFAALLLFASKRLFCFAATTGDDDDDDVVAEGKPPPALLLAAAASQFLVVCCCVMPLLCLLLLLLCAAAAGTSRTGPTTESQAEAMSAAVWRATWPVERIRQRAFNVFGMEMLISLDLKQTREFFSAFFSLSDFHW
jgi:hypothetical protein